MPESQTGSHNRIIDIVTRTIRSFRMINPRDSILVGVSGGPDSVALMAILTDLMSVFEIDRIGIAHLNHSLRGKQSDRDAEFVSDLCRRFHLPCHLAQKDVHQYQRTHKLSLEEAARQVRYDFYHHIARKHRYSRIALGHHADDNVELILMNLLRGSGNTGISGIPPVRDGLIIRPLIRLNRTDILGYLSHKELPYVTDSSNEDIRFLRNHIRHRLIPVLTKEYNPKLCDTFSRLATIVSCENEWMDQITDQLYHQALSASEPHRLIFSVSRLNEFHAAAVKRIFRRAINQLKGDLRRISYTHMDAAVQLLKRGPAVGSIDLPDRLRIYRNTDQLAIVRENHPLRATPPRRLSESEPGYEYTISGPGKIAIRETGRVLTFSVSHIEDILTLRPSGQHTAFFDMNTVDFPLTIRNSRPGDRFTPLGLEGTQKVKDFFIDHKVSRQERTLCPIVLSRSKIIWIAGHRIDDSAKITSSTRNVLKIEFLVA